MGLLLTIGSTLFFTLSLGFRLSFKQFLTHNTRRGHFALQEGLILTPSGAFFTVAGMSPRTTIVVSVFLTRNFGDAVFRCYGLFQPL